MKVGFIGLGHAGGKLAGTLLRNGVDLTVRDLDRAVAEPFVAAGASFAVSPKAMAVASTSSSLACLRRAHRLR